MGQDIILGRSYQGSVILGDTYKAKLCRYRPPKYTGKRSKGSTESGHTKAARHPAAMPRQGVTLRSSSFNRFM